jgi:tetratricopeptide (TPR) repeat protein
MMAGELAAAAASLLALYLGRIGGGVADRVAERVEDAAMARLEKLYHWVAGRLGSNMVRAEALALLEAEPDSIKRQSALQAALADVLSRKAGEARELAELVENARMVLPVGEAGAVAVGGNLTLQGRVVAGRDVLVETRNVYVPPSSVTAMFQLPPDIAEFTGRESALRRICDLMACEPRPSALVVCAVAGKGGVGKTTLVVRAAHQLASWFPDGQLYVDLRGVESTPLRSIDVLGELLRGLGVDPATIPYTLQGRQSLYRSMLADRRVLVVLDNAADEAQVRPLLPGSSSCGVLVTCRRPLGGLVGASLLHLDVLGHDQAVELLSKLCGADRVAAELGPAERIVRLCGHLPLAVAIAGAKLATFPHWSLSRLAERLAAEQHRLDELRVGDLEVRASFLTSYQGQTDDDRRAFRLLGILGPVTFPGWVLAPLLDTTVIDAEERIDRLVMAQLVEPDGSDQVRQLRYRLHDLLRVLAREHLYTEEPKAVRTAGLQRLLGAYLTFADRADEQLRPSGIRHTGRVSAPRWPVEPILLEVAANDPLGWFAAERSSLLAAVEQAHAAGQWALCWELADAMSIFFEFEWRWDDSQASYQLALQAADRLGSQAGRAALLRNLGQALRDQSRQQEAVRCLQEAAELFNALGDEYGTADTLGNLAILQRQRGAHDQAQASLTKCLTLFRKHGVRRGVAWSLREFGLIHRAHGRLQQAASLFEAAYQIFDEIGERRGAGWALGNLGQVYVDWCSGGIGSSRVA